MTPGRIRHTTRVLGESQGYLGLPIRDIEYEDGTPAMQSAWFPTPKEREAINTGSPIILTLLGTNHPPTLLDVGGSIE